MQPYEKYKAARNLLFITLGGFICYVTLDLKERYTVKYSSTIEQSNIIDTTFNEKQLIDLITYLEIKYPEIVLAQAKLESGNFTSNRFKQYNALFGFQTSDTNIIKYKSWKESVIHYKVWQMKRLKENEDYYDFLIRVKYSEDSSYINKLKQF